MILVYKTAGSYRIVCMRCMYSYTDEAHFATSLKMSHALLVDSLAVVLREMHHTPWIGIFKTKVHHILIGKNRNKQLFRSGLRPCGAVKCAKTHKCANAHICANISPTNVQTTTFVQTFRPQMCKSIKKKIHQPQMCKHHAYKSSLFSRSDGKSKNL